jgi:hypothetical protein
MCDASIRHMAIRSISNDSGRADLAKRGPAWTFYVWTAFAVVVLVATIVGLLYASAYR